MRSVRLTDIQEIRSVIPPGCVKLLLLVLPSNFCVLALLAKLLISSLHREEGWISSHCICHVHCQLASGGHPAQ